MKKLIVFIIASFIVLSSIAQDREDVTRGTFGKLSQSDRLVVDVFSDIWMKAPSDSMDIKQINRGANVSVVHEFPFGNSNFSFATGLSIGCHNLYSNAMPVKSFSLDSNGTKVFDGKTVFTKIPSKSADGSQDINFKNNKFTVIYADIPLEFRYRLKNNAFKLYLGGKVGIMLSNHTKYHGDNFNEVYPTGTIRIKEYKIPNVERFRYGLTARIGWKWIQVFGYYSLSHLFKKDKGPDMYPISVGLTISPY